MIANTLSIDITFEIDIWNLSIDMTFVWWQENGSIAIEPALL